MEELSEWDRDLSVYVEGSDKELASLLQAIQEPWGEQLAPVEEPLRGHLWRKKRSSNEWSRYFYILDGNVLYFFKNEVSELSCCN